MRSTTHIIHQATDALKQSAHPPLRHLKVTSTEAKLIIAGKVNCWYHKQMAQETVRHCAGHLELDNQVDVEAFA